ncbi:IS66 family insertion sequence element accessory protein TnpA [Frigoriglobus tundricola]|uniref:Uncharacterized protein n=1 Tax=Frigoriglobus tundricola TaxID=2774151 RepID=A0A6M5YTH8_9BACT|nr:hypothetical protein FTUN_0003 [Frigoriglobus tundricola]QJW94183.1 hypothetical protein FTUN_1702 [Frigoriglobus tundricola]QJW95213.1 hypothetical protein FTUN_2755 [Frigoriglobus tundricola]QJW97159.1 hypothetical protein FTUN_4724 [Frigoriglobus tundricola]
MPDSSVRSRSGASANRKWVECLERFAASNQTVAAFCTTEGVSLSNFYLWRRRLAQPAPPPVVVPMRVAPLPTPATPIELALPSGTVVRFTIRVSPRLHVRSGHRVIHRNRPGASGNLFSWEALA